MSKFLFIVLFCAAACKGRPGASALTSSHRREAPTETNKWSKEDEALFTAGCIGTAKGEVGQVKAESYCECMLNQLEQRFPNMDSSMNNPLDSITFNQLIEMCRQ